MNNLATKTNLCLAEHIRVRLIMDGTVTKIREVVADSPHLRELPSPLLRNPVDKGIASLIASIVELMEAVSATHKKVTPKADSMYPRRMDWAPFRDQKDLDFTGLREAQRELRKKGQRPMPGYRVTQGERLPCGCRPTSAPDPPQTDTVLTLLE